MSLSAGMIAGATISPNNPLGFNFINHLVISTAAAEGQNDTYATSLKGGYLVSGSGNGSSSGSSSSSSDSSDSSGSSGQVDSFSPSGMGQ